MAITELGDQKNERVVPFHQNFHQGIALPEAEKIWQRLTEVSSGSPEVKPIITNAEVVALEALSALPDRAEAA